MAATLSAGRNRIFPEGPNRVRRNSEGLSPATLFLKLNDNFSPTAAGSAEHTFRRRRLSASHDAGNKEDKPLFAKSRLSWVDGADADAEHTKAIRLLGVNVDAIDRSKCLKMMGVSEDDYQKSLDGAYSSCSAQANDKHTSFAVSP
uniref:Uncharacterized protein n=1 Tax=Spongospora subterranea TaxID=70186 RepID=A0A0H5QQV4_9EUKA|eukprot:CRZ03846.1 hypothetical protein [Spongospora subterranea]